MVQFLVSYSEQIMMPKAWKDLAMMTPCQDGDPVAVLQVPRPTFSPADLASFSFWGKACSEGFRDMPTGEILILAPAYTSPDAAGWARSYDGVDDCVLPPTEDVRPDHVVG